jgi:hypothetical protein
MVVFVVIDVVLVGAVLAESTVAVVVTGDDPVAVVVATVSARGCAHEETSTLTSTHHCTEGRRTADPRL